MATVQRRDRTDDDIEAGRMLRAARLRAGVTTAAAASAAEVTEDMIFRYERGASWPSYQKLARMAACYRIAIGDFFPNSGIAPESGLVAPLITAMGGMRDAEQVEMIGYLSAQVRMMRSWLHSVSRAEASQQNVLPFRQPEQKEMSEDGMRRLEEVMKQAGAEPRKAARGPEREVRFYGLASAGEGIEFFDDIPSEYRQIPQWAWKKGARGVFKAAGDSMHDVGIWDNDIMFIKPTPFPKNGEIVICTLNKKVFVKKLRTDASGRPTSLESKNEAYQPIPITPDDEVEFFGVVVGRTGDL